jgi:bifunctional oligoribonuclease and PAP phosphatase NrnA
MRPISEFYPKLSTPAKWVITMHQKPDADALGSSLGLKTALQRMGHEATVISPTNWPGFLNWMPGCSQVIDFESRRAFSESKILEARWCFLS